MSKECVEHIMALDGFSLAENGCVCKIKLFVQRVRYHLKM